MAEQRKLQTPKLGVGIYRLQDVARYVRMPGSTVRSWFNSHKLFRTELQPIMGVNAASFLDLIDVMVAKQFRASGVTMKIVRRAYEKLQDRLNTDHPFCHRGLYTDGKDIIVDVADRLGDHVLQSAVSAQGFFPELRHQLKHVAYSAATQIAARWSIHRGIVVDPAVALGQPAIQGTGITTYVVGRAFEANDRDAMLVAAMFSISQDQVTSAVKFETSIRTAA